MLDQDHRALLDGLERPALDANGVPDDDLAARRRRAHEHAVRVLGPLVPAASLRVSPLGPEWSSDVDVHAAPPPAQVLEAAGWIRLDALLRRLGSRARDVWAVCDESVLGRVDFDPRPAPDPVDAVVARARRRREVRLREVLELRALARGGAQLPADAVVTAAADVEEHHGGSVLAAHRSGPARPGPAPLAPDPRPAAVRRLLALRRRPVVLALSGVDGAGKSTLGRQLVADLTAAGLDVGVVWTRPGMGLGGLATLARTAKRVLRQDTAPGVRAVASGAGASRSRTGFPGLVWALLVCASFSAQALRPLLSGRQVLVYDRHLPDALVTLDVFYPGIPTTLPHRLVRAVLPRAALACYLDVPADVLRARKPDDLMGAQTVDAQLAAYARRLPALPRVEVVDGTRPPHELSLHLVRRLAGGR